MSYTIVDSKYFLNLEFFPKFNERILVSRLLMRRMKLNKLRDIVQYNFTNQQQSELLLELSNKLTKYKNNVPHVTTLFCAIEEYANSNRRLIPIDIITDKIAASFIVCLLGAFLLPINALIVVSMLVSFFSVSMTMMMVLSNHFSANSVHIQAADIIADHLFNHIESTHQLISGILDINIFDNCVSIECYPPNLDKVYAFKLKGHDELYFCVSHLDTLNKYWALITNQNTSLPQVRKVPSDYVFEKVDDDLKRQMIYELDRLL